MKPTHQDFVAVLQVEDDVGSLREALVLLKSAEGYATVVTLTNRADPAAGLNRVPSQRDYEAVLLAATQVAAAFLRLGIFPAMELLGNNSHGVKPGGGLELGNRHEPFQPHVHVIGRGDPMHAYVAGCPLRGLPPGEVMVPRQRTETFAEGQRRQVACGLAASLEAVALHPSVRLVERKRM